MLDWQLQQDSKPVISSLNFETWKMTFASRCTRWIDHFATRGDTSDEVFAIWLETQHIKLLPSAPPPAPAPVPAAAATASGSGAAGDAAAPATPPKRRKTNVALVVMRDLAGYKDMEALPDDTGLVVLTMNEITVMTSMMEAITLQKALVYTPQARPQITRYTHTILLISRACRREQAELSE